MGWRADNAKGGEHGEQQILSARILGSHGGVCSDGFTHALKGVGESVQRADCAEERVDGAAPIRQDGHSNRTYGHLVLSARTWRKRAQFHTFRSVSYFLILPAFVLWVLALSTATLATYLLPSLARWRPYCLSILLWSSIGFVLSTLVYALAAVAVVGGLSQLLEGEPSTVGGVATGLMVFVVPFVAAAVGVFGGAAYGVRRAFKNVRAAA